MPLLHCSTCRQPGRSLWARACQQNQCRKSQCSWSLRCWLPRRRRSRLQGSEALRCTLRKAVGKVHPVSTSSDSIAATAAAAAIFGSSTRKPACSRSTGTLWAHHVMRDRPCFQAALASTPLPLRQRPLMGPQPPVELHVTLGAAGTPKYPASHRPVQMLLTGLVGEQLKLPLAGLGGGKLHTAGSSNRLLSVGLSLQCHRGSSVDVGSQGVHQTMRRSFVRFPAAARSTAECK